MHYAPLTWLAQTTTTAAPPPAAPPPTETVNVTAMLSGYMAVFFVAFFVAFVATPLMRLLALKLNIVDRPNVARKVHLEPIAYLGGIALFLGWAAGVATVYFDPPTDPTLEAGNFDYLHTLYLLLIGATVIVVVGLVDDIRGSSPRVKIGGQLIAAACLAQMDIGSRLVSAFFVVAGIPESPEIAYILGALVIAIFVVGACNSMNLLDGLDGLAAGVSGISCAGFLMISITVAMVIFNGGGFADGASPVRIVTCLALIGAVLGFLPYNFNPANIFMGDAGSMLLGYLCVSVILLFGDVPIRGPLLVMASLIVFAVPIIDSLLAIVRRKMHHQPLFSADDRHLHHQILRAYRRIKFGPNVSVKAAVVTMYGMSAMFAVLGYLMVLIRWRFVAAMFFALFGFVIVSAYKSGHRSVLLDKSAGASQDDTDESGNDDQSASAADGHNATRTDSASPPAKSA